MHPRWHLLYSFVFSLVLFEFVRVSFFVATVIFFSSILIDLDHYLLYFIRTKNFNPFSFWEWSMDEVRISERNKKLPQYFFHGVESLVVLTALSFFHKIFAYIAVGFIFHLFLDYLHLYFDKRSLTLKASQIAVYKLNKNLKNKKGN